MEPRGLSGTVIVLEQRGDGASTVLPHQEGIHRAGTPGADTTVSVYLYGPRVGEIDGRAYDPSRDYMCDRREE
jgi:hypothetical protein